MEASGKTREELATTLLRSSAYNFLFVVTALEAVEGGQLRLDELEKLPPGLGSLYEVFFKRLFPDPVVDFPPARQVLEVVAAASEPLTRMQIAAVTGLDAEGALPPLLGRVASFVPVREGCYSLFHRSLFDWLTGWDPQQDQPLAGAYHISLPEGQKRLADWGWSEYGRGVQTASPYCLRHLVAHLHEVGWNEQARTVLLDFGWLQTKLLVTDPNALIADYDYLAADEDLRLIQSAVRLSAPVLSRHAQQLPAQLTGRLLGDETPSIQALVNQAAEWKAWPWFRPLAPSLTSAGGPMIRTLEGHTSYVNAVAVTPDGRRAVSGSDDQTLRLWDLESGEEIAAFTGESGMNCCTFTPDGRTIVAGDQSGRVHFLWVVEADPTKPAPKEIKIQLLRRQEPATPS